MHTTLIQLVVAYKYSLLVPIAFFEGHIISLIVGFSARLGIINPFWGGALIVIGNLLGDTALYWLGFHQGKRAIRRWGKYFDLTDSSVEKAREIFHAHKSKILFTSKVTNGFGLAMGILFTAGMTRIPFGIFMAWNVAGECVWTGLLVAAGYFFGHLYVTIDAVVWRIGLVGVAALVIVALMRAQRYFRKIINP
jgi:membrane protein DedA with SNARE-associated domain